MTDPVHFDLLVLHSKDIERLKEFYESVLGVTFQQERHGCGPVHYAVNVNGITLEIYPTKEEIGMSASPGFAVSDLDAIIRKVGGEAVHSSTKETEYGRRAILKDPDGRLVHLVQSKDCPP